MRPFLRFTSLALFVFSFAAFSFGQVQATDADGAAATVKGSAAGYVRALPVPMNHDQATQTAIPTLDFPNVPNADSSRVIFSAGSGAASDTSNNAGTGADASPSGRSDSEWDRDDRRPNRPSIDGLDSVATFSGAFINQAGPSLGRLLPFIIMGNHPLAR